MKKVIPICLAVMLCGCAATNKDDTLASHQLAGPIESSLQPTDRLNLSAALETTPTNQTRSWQDSHTKNTYALTPTRTFYIDNKPCREYALAAEVGDNKQTYQGRACRNENGAWITSEQSALKK